jgi:hypothetical protein
MKQIAKLVMVVAVVATMSMATVGEAEAGRRGWGIAAGIIGLGLLGATIAHSHHHHYYDDHYPYPRRRVYGAHYAPIHYHWYGPHRRYACRRDHHW